MEVVLIRFPILALAVMAWPSQAAPRYLNTVDLSAITAEQLRPVQRRILFLALTGETAITLRIDSPGGEIMGGLRFIRDVGDIQKAHPEMRITCVVDGRAASMAAVILESPVCQRRLATPTSYVLFHHGRALGVDGTAPELRQAAHALDVMNAAMAGLVSTRIGIPLPAYRYLIAHSDWILGAPEALAVHVLDGLVDSSEVAPPWVG